MNNIDLEIERVSNLLRQSGAVVGMDTAAPEHVKRAFLDMILNCPDCQAELNKSNGKGASK